MKTTSLPLLAVLLAGLHPGASPQARADYAGAVSALTPILNYRFENTNQVPSEFGATNTGSLGTAFSGDYQAMSDTRGLTGALAGDADTAVSIVGTSGQQIVVPYSPVYNPTSDFSVEFWAKPANIDGGRHTVAITMVNGQNAGNANDRSGWAVRHDGGDWTFVLGFDHSDGATFYHTTLVAPGTAVAETWQHVVAVYTATAVTLFVNGEVAATMAPTLPVMPNTLAPLILGDRGYTGWDYNGQLDEFAVYTNALSAVEIKSHYDNGLDSARTKSYSSLVKEKNPALYLRLGEPSLTLPVAANSGSIGTDGDALYYAGSTPGIAGPRSPAVSGFASTNHAVRIDKAGSYIKIPSQTLSLTEVTFSGWVKRVGALPGRAAIIFQRASSGSGASGLGVNDDGVSLSYHWNDAGNTYGWNPGLTIPDNAWTFVALSVLPDSAVMYMGTASGLVAATNTVTHEVHDFSISTIDIGLDPTASSRTFTGSLDEISMFDKALDYSQINTLFKAALPAILSISRTPEDPVYEGSTVTFQAGVVGTTSPTYQWMKGGAPVFGQTTSKLVLTNVVVADSGNYSLEVKSGALTLSESAGTLTVISSEPRFSKAPLPAVKFINGSVKFEASVYGSVPLTYQWKHGSDLIPGATTTSLSLTDLQSSDAGDYTLVAMNPLGTNEITASLTLITPSTYSSVVTDLGPLGYWRLNEDSGTNVFDAWGGRDGLADPGVTNNIAGPQSPDFKGFSSTNTGYDFNGGSGVVNVPALNLNSATMTIVAWIKPNGAQSDYTGLVFSRAGGTVAGLDFQQAGQLGYHWNDAANTYGWGSGLNPELGKWNFVALVVEPTKATMYLDSGSGLQSSVNDVTHASEEFDGPIRFGAESSGNRAYKGSMDDIAIFDHSLSGDEIAALHDAGFAGTYGGPVKPVVVQQPKSQTILVGTPYTFTSKVSGSVPLAFQWQKNGVDIAGATRSSLTLASTLESDTGSYKLVVKQGAFTTNSLPATLAVKPVPSYLNVTNDLVLHLTFDTDYKDTSGRANDGTAVGTPAIVAGQVGAGALEYSTDPTASTYNYVSLGSPADLVFPVETSFTVAYWVKITGKPGDLPFLSSANNSYGNPGMTFTAGYGAGSWSYYLGSDASAIGLYGKDNSINDGQWHSLVHVFDRAGDAITYLDGITVDTRSMAGVGGFENAAGFNIGQDPTGTYGEKATEYLDDLGIWRRALNEYEAKSISIVGRLGRSFNSVGQAPVTMSVQPSAGSLVISYASGTLESATTVAGPWTTVSGATAPTATLTPSAAQLFYRVKVSN